MDVERSKSSPQDNPKLTPKQVWLDPFEERDLIYLKRMLGLDGGDETTGDDAALRSALAYLASHYRKRELGIRTGHFKRRGGSIKEIYYPGID